MKKIALLAGCIVLCLFVGALSGIITTKEIQGWYTTISKPSFNPPNAIFGPVWTFLYLTMGISLFFIVNSKSDYKRPSLIVFGIQLFLNFLWSVVFFRFHNIGLALIDILLLWLSILGMIVLFYKVRKVAGLLQLPYIFWVTFASVLNMAILVLN